MNIYLKIIGVIAIVGALYFYGESRYNAGYETRNAEQTKQDLIASEAARKKEKEWGIKLTEAKQNANIREKKLSDDAINSAAAADRLRKQLTALRSDLPRLTEQAVRQYADTASVVFAECTDRYTELAKTADSIDSDRQKLEDAWPK